MTSTWVQASDVPKVPPSDTFEACLSFPVVPTVLWVCVVFQASVLFLSDRFCSHSRKFLAPRPLANRGSPPFWKREPWVHHVAPSLLSLGFMASFPYWAGMPSLPTGFPPYKGPEACHSRPILSPIYIYNFCGLTALRSDPLFYCLFGFVG